MSPESRCIGLRRPPARGQTRLELEANANAPALCGIHRVGVRRRA
jgi:hypothetical protein